MSPSDPMRGWVAAFPAMLRDAWDAAVPSGFPLDPGRCTLLGGMGGSGIAGALAASHLQRRGRPILSWRDPELPAWLGPEDRLVIVSYSGETWEAAALLETALERGIPARVVASGGRLAARAADRGIPLFLVPPGLAPRASLPWLLAGVLRAVDGAERSEIDRCARLLEAERDHPPPGREPARVAEGILGKIACLIPIGAVMESVAVRWRSQIVENAEQAAMVAPLPEMAHNEVMGWRFLAEARIPIAYWLIPEASSSGGVYDRLVSALRAEAGRWGGGIELVDPPAAVGLPGLLAQVYLGDRASVELAEMRGIAATPVEAIARLRAVAGKEPKR